MVRVSLGDISWVHCLHLNLWSCVAYTHLRERSQHRRPRSRPIPVPKPSSVPGAAWPCVIIECIFKHLGPQMPISDSEGYRESTHL